MAQVTYRGVQYDTETRLQEQKIQQPQQKQLVYRGVEVKGCLLYTSPSPRDATLATRISAVTNITCLL